LWEQLFSEKINQISDVLIIGKIDVLPWVLEAHLDLVHQGSAHGNDHGLDGGSVITH